MTAESITCPQCGRVSHNPNDVRERYCGACHQFHDRMAELAELEPWQRAYLEGFLHGMRERTEASPPTIDITIDVDDSRFRSAMYQAHQKAQWFEVVDELHAWWERSHSYVGDLRDEFGELVPERDPAPCGWYQRDGFRLGGVAADVEPLPLVKGGLSLW